MNPFDFVNSISFGKNDMMKADSLCEKEYLPFIVNKAFSYYPDTIFHAQVANGLNNQVDKRLQYDYLLHSVTKKKRYAKWHKNEDDVLIDALKFFFKYSNRKIGGAHV